jgi:hypothetical protein
VLHREYYGHDCIVLVGTENEERPLRVRCPGRSPVQVGDTVLMSAQGDVIAWQSPAGNQAPAAQAADAPVVPLREAS